jgi:hypothetical protein
MYALTDKRFADFFKHQPETGMGYWVATAVLTDGRQYRQVLVNSGFITRVKGYEEIPFVEPEIDHFIVTHEKWDFRGTI